MKYIIKWLDFERASNVETYILTTPLEFYDIVNVIKIHYNLQGARCLCLLEERGIGFQNGWEKIGGNTK